MSRPGTHNIRRERGDIENDIGYVDGEIADMQTQLEGLRKERDALLAEMGDFMANR